MPSVASPYVASLRSVIEGCGDYDSLTSDPVFETLCLPAQADLDDAIGQSGLIEQKIISVLDELKIDHEMRSRTSPKKLERIVAKVADQAKRTKFRSFLKVHSDFIAFQVKCDYTRTDEIFDALKKKFTLCIKRNSIRDADGNFVDVVLYCYVWDPETKYLAEIQFGHPFIIYVHARDSPDRDLAPADKKFVDLWTDDFAWNVCQKILGEKPDFDVLGSLKKIYGGTVRTNARDFAWNVYQKLIGKNPSFCIVDGLASIYTGRPIEEDLLKILRDSKLIRKDLGKDPTKDYILKNHLSPKLTA